MVINQFDIVSAKKSFQSADALLSICNYHCVFFLYLFLFLGWIGVLISL